MRGAPRYLLICAFIIALGHRNVEAVPQTAGFSLYTHAFLDPEQRPTVLVSVNLPYANLIFFKKGGVFNADYSLYIKVLDKKKKVVETAVVSESVVVEDYESTRSGKQTSRVSKRFYLEQGDYIVQCVLQVKNTNRVFQKEATVTVPKFIEAGIGLGKPRLFVADVDTSRYAPVLVKTTAFENVIGKEKENTTFAEFDKWPALGFDVYLEEESGDSLDCYLYYEIVSSNDDQLLYGRKKVRVGGVRSQFVVFANVDDWDPGPYVFNVEVVQTNPPRATAGTLEFTVAFSRAMLTKHFDETLSILSLIASNEELRELREADVEDRPRAWSKFWVRRDPTPGTEQNEALEEHLRRIRYVTENFSVGQEGWKTDRGKVYITYGEPDEVETRIDAQYQGEFLYWHYYKENRTFVFYDRFGLGEYQLTNSGQL